MVTPYCAKHNIRVVDGGSAGGPTDLLDTLATDFVHARELFDRRLVDHLERMFARPTPVQAISWPIAAAGHDLVAVAETGSGKTLAYVLPAMRHARRQASTPTQQCSALVLAPTRELASQIGQQVAAHGAPIDLRSACCYGGTDVRHDLETIADGVELLVGTPGRILLIASRHAWLLSKASLTILDEADRMLDMGFEQQVRDVLAHAAARRQTLLFTATWPAHVRSLASELLSAPVHVRIGPAAAANGERGDTCSGGQGSAEVGATTDDDVLRAVRTITQEVRVISEAEKPAHLRRLLAERGYAPQGASPPPRALLFVNTKAGCAQLASELAALPGAPAVDALHGDRPQHEREEALAAFARGDVRLLVATDVAARGIDVADIGLVVNCDVPMAIGAQGIEDYVHRIGRTGRAGAGGLAVTLFSRETDGKAAHALIQILTAAGQRVPAELRALDQGAGVLSARQKRKGLGRAAQPGARARGGRGPRGI